MREYPEVEAERESSAPLCRVLLVEDDPDVVCLVDLALQPLAGTVTLEHVADVPSALLAIEKNTFDVVLADYVLDGSKPGLVLEEIVRTHLPHARFAMTTSLPLREHLQLSGGSDVAVLRKPFTPLGCQQFLRALV